MKISLKCIVALAIGVIMLPLVSCEDGQSYAEMLNSENQAVNRFLVDQKVIPQIPADSVFEAGENAPYYQIDEDGNIYMQVVKYGDGAMVEDDQRVYFRFMRYNLMYYGGPGQMPDGDGNKNNLAAENTYFVYNNYTLPTSSSWGSGIQIPLRFVPLNSEVNVVIKSQYGMTSEMSYVQPFLYNITYFKSQI
ncbi:MAG: DUF4827 domain-containing protein [Muribaculaceae bacterium]|nr:DUF4827 domain-containing protein [Muribaculaceae bacterium]